MEPHLFNNDTCSCTCDSSPYKRDETHCAKQFERKWDPLTCSCRNTDESIMYEKQNTKNLFVSIYKKKLFDLKSL